LHLLLKKSLTDYVAKQAIVCWVKNILISYAKTKVEPKTHDIIAFYSELIENLKYGHNDTIYDDKFSYLNDISLALKCKIYFLNDDGYFIKNINGGMRFKYPLIFTIKINSNESEVSLLLNRHLTNDLYFDPIYENQTIISAYMSPFFSRENIRKEHLKAKNKEIVNSNIKNPAEMSSIDKTILSETQKLANQLNHDGICQIQSTKSNNVEEIQKEILDRLNK